MRLFFLLAAWPLMAPSVATEPNHAGMTRLTVAGPPPSDVLVWYPTDAAEVPWQVDGYRVPASHDAPIADGRFPVVLLSHGGGIGGGKPFVLSELLSALARQGFVVIAPFHGTSPLRLRPSQVRLALDGVAADARFKPHLDAARLAMIGFSLGGAVTLELAGARPDFLRLDAYCDAHPDDVMSCNHAPGGGGRGSSSPPASIHPPPLPEPLPLKALVLLDPFAVLFPRDHLTSVTMPVLLFRPDQSELPGEGNAVGLASALPRRPQYQTIPGSHFIFLNVCTSALRAAAPEACQDAPGVDRVAVHAAIEAQIIRFFRDSL